MNITKADLCNRISKSLKSQGYKVSNKTYTLDEIKLILDIFFDEVLDNLSEGQRIEIRGFGCYTIKNRKARIGRNPRTGQLYDIPCYKAPLFKFSEEALAIFNKKLNSAKE